MIFDEKQNLDFYRNLGIEGRYAKAVDFLKNTDLAALEPGKYEIDGKDVYANVTAYTTIPWEEAKYEAHEHYTDIQYVIEGSEVMTYAPVHEMTVKTPYNPDKDVVFFENTTDGLQVVVKLVSISSSIHGMHISRRQLTALRHLSRKLSLRLKKINGSVS